MRERKMRRTTRFWQLRVILPVICLLFIMQAKNVYGTESNMVQVDVWEVVREYGGANAEHAMFPEICGQASGKPEDRESTQEAGEENNRQETEKKAVVKAKELDMGDYQTVMEIGESQLLAVTVLPIDATDQAVAYASDNEEVATINSMGRIRANAAGTAKITVSCGSVKESFILTVSEPKSTEETIVAVTDIEISDYEKELKVDTTLALSTTILPTNATEHTVTYRSSNPSIATVNSSGEVKGIASGNVIIYCSAGSVTKEVPLTIKVATEKD